MNTPYSQLCSPGHIGTLTLKNRMVVSAMGANLSDADGHWGARVRAYHTEQARGGAGLIISGACGVMYPRGQVQPHQLALADDGHVAGLARVVDAVHSHGARLAVQLHHGGLNAVDDTVAGRPQWCPSEPEFKVGDFIDGMLPEELQAFASGGMPAYHVMNSADISVLTAAFAAAAKRAQQAGCDAVEIHAGHGYVISSFLSAATNKRSDAYGGSLANRARLLLETLAAVRGAVGAAFPVIVKIDAFEAGREGGICLEDAITTARWLEQGGASAITVSAYHDTSVGKLHSASNIPDTGNALLPAARAIRAALQIPVIALGRVEPAHAEREIRRGSFDFLGLGRKLLADPQLPAKLAQGRATDVRPCIYCYTCVSAIYTRDRLRCAVNPECGREYSRAEARAPLGKKRIVVVGGGPGGMEAARRAALAGHQVTLLERASRLGGTLRFASVAYAANGRLLQWLQQQLRATGVDVRIATEATASLLQSLAVDEVIVATGARRPLPALPGAQLPHIYSGDDMRDLLEGARTARLRGRLAAPARMLLAAAAASGFTANLALLRWASRRWMPLGNAVVVIGSELVALELAEFLCARGRRVTVLGEAPRLGAGLPLVRRLRVLAQLREHGVELVTAVRRIEIESSAVVFDDPEAGPRRVTADQVIVAQGAAGDSSQADAFRAAGLAVHEIGDGTGVGYIEGAMRDALEVVDRINAGVDRVPITAVDS